MLYLLIVSTHAECIFPGDQDIESRTRPPTWWGIHPNDPDQVCICEELVDDSNPGETRLFCGQISECEGNDMTKYFRLCNGKCERKSDENCKSDDDERPNDDEENPDGNNEGIEEENQDQDANQENEDKDGSSSQSSEDPNHEEEEEENQDGSQSDVDADNGGQSSEAPNHEEEENQDQDADQANQGQDGSQLDEDQDNGGDTTAPTTVPILLIVVICVSVLLLLVFSLYCIRRYLKNKAPNTQNVPVPFSWNPADQRNVSYDSHASMIWGRKEKRKNADKKMPQNLMPRTEAFDMVINRFA